MTWKIYLLSTEITDPMFCLHSCDNYVRVSEMTAPFLAKHAYIYVRNTYIPKVTDASHVTLAYGSCEVFLVN